jgi:hypothetical protein
MATANPLWGAPRIHGELRAVGVDVSERTVSRLLAQHPRPRSQTWRTFPTNHVACAASMDFFTVPTITGRVALVALLLFTGPITSQECLHGTDESAENAGKRQHFVRIVRVINIVQKEQWEATGRYLTRHDMAVKETLRSRDGDSVVEGLVFDGADEFIDLRLTTDPNSYTLSLKDKADPCGFALSTDQSGVIYRAEPVR